MGNHMEPTTTVICHHPFIYFNISTQSSHSFLIQPFQCNSLNMDPWDEVVCVEENAYKDGVEEGKVAALSEGHLEEGEKGGFMRAYALGLEFGFMESVANSLVHDSNESTVAKRLYKRRTELVERIHGIPNHNNPETDFDNELRECRGLYKQCGGDVGAFLKHKQTKEESNAW